MCCWLFAIRSIVFLKIIFTFIRLKINDQLVYTSDNINYIMNKKPSYKDLEHEVKNLESIIKKQLDHKQLKNQYYLRRTQEIGKICIWEFDIKQNIIDWTYENFNIFEIAKEKRQNFDHLIKYIHPEDKDWVNHQWYKLLTGEPYDIEYKIVVSKKIKWIKEITEVEVDHEGCPLTVIGVIQDITKRKNAEIALKNIATKFSAITGCEFFEKICLHVVDTLRIEYAFIGELIGDDRVKVIAGIGNGEPMFQMIYDLKDTPCDNVVDKSVCCYPSNIQTLFPKDSLLAEMGVNSYVGIPLINSKGIVIGIMVLLDSKTISDPEIYISLLEVFSERVIAEIERMQAEENLKRSKEVVEKSEYQLRESQQIARIGSWELNLLTNELIWSEMTYILFEKDQNLFTPSFDELARLIYPQDYEIMQQSLDAALKSDDNPYNIVVRVVNESGREWHMESFGKVYRDKDGKAIRIAGTAQDVSERYWLKKLNESNERFLNIFYQSPIAIELFDTNGLLIDANPSCLEIFGIDNIDEVKGFNLFDDPNFPEISKERLLKEGKYVNYDNEFDFELVRKNKLYKTSKRGKSFLSIFVSPLKLGNNELHGYLVHIIDISNLKKVEQELISSKERSEESEEQLKERVKELKCLFNITEISEETHLTTQDILKRIVEILPIAMKHSEVANARIVVNDNEFRSKTFKEYECSIKNDLIIHNEVRGFIEINYTKNGKHVFLEEEELLLKSVTEQVGRIIERKELEEVMENFIKNQEILIKMRTAELSTTNKKLNLEIANRKQNEKQLEEQRNELKELNATKDKFFSIIAHDLKNPFSSIIGFIDILSSNYNEYDDKKKKEFIDLIKKDANNYYKLLQNLLEWARLQTNQISIKKSKFSINMLIKKEIELVRPLAEKKNIKIVSKIDKVYSVKADKNIISTIFRNIITNAIKYTNQKGLVVVDCKEIYINDNRIQLELEIKDNGVGINSSKLKKLFKINNNISTTGTEGEEGTGLGLILCNEFIQKHGGDLRVESEVGKGTTFYFTLEIV